MGADPAISVKTSDCFIPAGTDFLPHTGRSYLVESKNKAKPKGKTVTFGIYHAPRRPRPYYTMGIEHPPIARFEIGLSGPLRMAYAEGTTKRYLVHCQSLADFRWYS